MEPGRASGGSPGSYLHHGDLVGHQPITDHNVALGDIQALLSHAGGEEQVEGSLAEQLDHVLLLILREEGVMLQQLHRAQSPWQHLQHPQSA